MGPDTGVSDRVAGADAFLEERLRRYDGWMKEGLVPHASRVIPVGRAIAGQQWVLPRQQLTAYLTGATVFALAHCGCRQRYHRCDNPRETCFVLDDLAERRIVSGVARHVSLDEAEHVAGVAEANGLVHLAIYVPDHRFEAVCSCCHDLQALSRYGRADLVARSDYVAQVYADRCDGCGHCAARCPFAALTFSAGKVTLAKEQCFGCGVCVASCPTGALGLEQRQQTPACASFAGDRCDRC